MEKKMIITLTKEELEELIKQHVELDGNVVFNIEEEYYNQGYSDEGAITKSRTVLKGATLTNTK